MTLPAQARLERDWAEARGKVEGEGRCRSCGLRAGELRAMGRTLEAAHLMGREHDFFEPLLAVGVARVRREGRLLVVEPERVVPLCGPVTDPETCHSLYDRRQLDLAPRLARIEELQAVADAGSLSAALYRLTGDRAA